MTKFKSPSQVLDDFYTAERKYMLAGGKAGGASFDEFGATMDENIVLHQTPDLLYGGEWIGRERVAECFARMSSYYDNVDVQDPVFVENGDVVIVTCTLVTTSKATKEVLKNPMVQVVTVKEGKITDFRPFYWDVPSYVASVGAK